MGLDVLECVFGVFMRGVCGRLFGLKFLGLGLVGGFIVVSVMMIY